MSSIKKYDGIVCVKPGCESTWFQVEAVQADQDFKITNHVGLLFCITCGTLFLRRKP